MEHTRPLQQEKNYGMHARTPTHPPTHALEIDVLAPPAR